MSGRLELVREVADFLISDVNNRIANVPKDVGDAAPPAIATYKNTIAVFDETRHDWVADKKEPPIGAVPCLYVRATGVLAMKGEPTPDGQIRETRSPSNLAILYLTANGAPAKAMQDGYYTLRAVARSLRELSKDANYASRQRNGINVVLGETMDFWPIGGAVGQNRIAGALIVGYYVRDQNPSY